MSATRKHHCFCLETKATQLPHLLISPWEIIIALSGTLGSKATLLISHSGLIGLLAKLPSFLLLTSPLPFCAFHVARNLHSCGLEQNPALYFLHLSGCHVLKSPPERLTLLDRGKESEVLLQRY
jgi:hypothetical protein